MIFTNASGVWRDSTHGKSVSNTLLPNTDGHGNGPMSSESEPYYNDDPLQMGLFEKPSTDSLDGQALPSTLREIAKAGPDKCFCCGGITRLYRRKLNSGMAAALCWVVANHGREWVHMPTQAPRRVLRNGNHTKLPHWGFMEAKPNDDPSKKDSGYFRATSLGEQFARGRITTQSHAFIRSPGDVLEGFETTTISVWEALGKHFSYAQLMSGD